MTKTTKYTLQDALAYVAITGGKRSLTVDTRISLYPYLNDLDVNTLTYTLNEEGRTLAFRSRLWKAHEFLFNRGYRLETHRKTRLSHLTYVLRDEDGKVVRTAFTGRHGSVYEDQNEGMRSWEFKLTQKFRNGD